MNMLTRMPLAKKDFTWMHVTPADIAKAGRELVRNKKAAYANVIKIKKEDRTFANTLFALEKASAESHEAFQKIHFLGSVSADKAVREAAHRAEVAARKETIEIAFDKRIYNAIKEYAGKKENLAGPEKKLLADYLRSYKRMGFELPEGKRTVLKNNLKLISTLQTEFEKNINDYKDEIVVSKEDLDGLPDNYILGLKKDKAGYHVGLSYPELIPFMEYSPRSDLRQALADKNSMKGGKRNLAILEKLVRLRDKNAKLLGYKSHAHYILEERMAKTPEIVNKFLTGLVSKIAPAKKKELAELRDFKRTLEKDPNAELHYYDGAYYVERLKHQKLKLNSEELREYFPFDHIKKSVFDMYGTLLSLSFKQIKNIPLYHKSAELYEVKDKGGSLIGYFIIDLYPREGKYSHACASDIVKPMILAPNSNEYQTPVSAMIANFAKPLPGKPSLMSHDEVETFFHEFGHLMHSLLSTAHYPSQSGFAVSLDFVEIPSQFFENWVWDKKMLTKLGRHYKTGNPMPESMIAAISKSRTFRTASWVTGQIVNSLFDLNIHTKVPTQKLHDLSREMSIKYNGIAPSSHSLHPAGFGHLAGEYDAGYYSYLWSLVYAHDLFTRFQKEGLLNPKTGRDYRDIILAKGSSLEEMELLKQFLHRGPNNKAFLSSLGL